MITAEDIITEIKCLRFIGNRRSEVHRVVPASPANRDEDVIMWCGEKNIHLLEELKAGTIICPPLAEKLQLNENCNYIISENPRRYFQQVLLRFFTPKPVPGISPSAVVHPTACIGDDVTIGHHVVIEENCVIGNHTIIGHNTVILKDTIIGSHVKLGCNNTIGGTGFGYEKDDHGQYQLLPHIGNVIIKDHVEIGNNTTIDRAVLLSTVINENVKIDNLVHIAHNVQVGQNSLIIANSMIGGSTIIGENAWIAPSSSLINKISVGNDATVGLGAVVLKDVEASATVYGNPARIKEK